MACQALGRCRICARRHKIAVFGGEEAQHFFIEKANLKLIILNSVCIVCISKIEKFVDKMDLDTVFADSVKQETIKSPKQSSLSCDSIENIKKDIKIEEFDLETDSMPMQIDQTSPNYVTDELDTQTRFTHRGDSQTRYFPHLASTQQIRIGDKLDRGDEPCRKRSKNTHLIRLPENAMSVIKSSALKLTVDDCGSAVVKKGGRFLSCDFCKKEFTHAGDLNKHRRKHTGEKPYECNQCERKFAHTSNLVRHQRVHSGERPFACTKCGRTFTRKDKLGIHIAADKCTQNNLNESQTYQGGKNAEITQT